MNCNENCTCSEDTNGRRFLTKEEKVARLREYHTWLSHEAKGVEEAIARVEART